MQCEGNHLKILVFAFGYKMKKRKKRVIFQITIIIPTQCHLMSTAINSVVYCNNSVELPIAIIPIFILGMWGVLNCFSSIQSK